jgi:putative PIN family toxin of toxin-antitoxin system
VRAVFDPNVLVSALLAPTGAPAELILRWLAGDFELVVSEQLLEELERTLAYPKIRRRISAADADAFVALLRDATEVASDPLAPPRRSPDPGDDYLLALAEREGAFLVSGDQHVLSLADDFPVRTPRAFLDGLKGGARE